MKLSKPVLLILIFSVGLLIYLFFFTGKKAPAPVQPKPDSAKTAAQAPLQPTRGGSPQPAIAPEQSRTQLGQLNISWDRDPFVLPKSLEQKSTDQQGAPFKLVAILESKKGRFAIINNSIVAKGDIINNERVQEIGKDRVVLINNGKRRVISVPDIVGEAFTKGKPKPKDNDKPKDNPEDKPKDKEGKK